MPRYTETYDLREEADRLDEELDRLADEVSEIEEEKDEEEDLGRGRLHTYREAVQEASRVEQMYAGVQWALDPDDDHEPIEEATIGSLTAGEYAKVGDRVQALRKNKTGWGKDPDVDNARRNMFSAACLQDAPFLDENANFESRARAVTQLAPAFIFWLEEKGDELTTPRVEGNGFRTRVEEKKTAPTPNSRT